MIIIPLIVLGLCFGSFVNALVWRIHKQATLSKKTKTAKYSVLNGRSMCVNCGHRLQWYDLLPLVSWLSLGGRCRYCKKPISWQYPIVETVTAALFVFSYIYWPFSTSGEWLVLFGLWLTLLTGFVALAVYDLRWMILPDRIVFPLQAIAGMYVLTLFVLNSGDWVIITGAILGVLCSAGVFYVLFQVSKGKWIGGGDVKLAVALGLVLGGAAEALLMLFVASVLGTLIGLPLLIKGKAKANSKLPFGPFLLLATIITVLFGATILDWYKNQIIVF